ncbi:Clp protease N-terminal domain-containing protein [Streptomyces sulphureus]|uniref:Clp protease N-terminal domain-containing protein n=1 Tax=Streptomyces sulphureus TaxID=47758 RepID=UPI000375A163|nr:Clp protease N-terminal domain-containing protein [Streptomyces sulphureus]
MQIPMPSDAESSTGHPESQVSEAVAVMVAAARRRAARDGDRQVDTAHLLHSVLESDREVWELLEGGAPQLGRLLGYLVQRSVGYGLKWQGSVEDSGSLPAVAEQPGGAAGWSPSASAALECAVCRAQRRGVELAEGIDLFAGIVADRECRAVEVLDAAGVDVELLAVRLGTGREEA